MQATMLSPERKLMEALSEMARNFDAEVESRLPVSLVQMGADLLALRKKRHMTSESVALIFNEQFAEYGITLSGSSLRSYERGETEIPARTRDLLLVILRAPGGINYVAESYRPDIRKALGMKTPD